MKVLSVKNPWAYLIIHCGKDVENRTWETKYRGPLLIHASRSMDIYAPRDIRLLGINWFDYNGYIIGKVNLADCIRDSKSEWAEEGLWHWVLEDPKPCAPIPVKGSLGLWEYTGEIKPCKSARR
jgi:hypothetical protein